jgi:hypothetical protein
VLSGKSSNRKLRPRRNLSVTLWTPIKLCSCCGKFVILLRIPEAQQVKDRPKKKAYYFKGWDGSPWFTRDSPRSLGNAYPHSRKQYARRMFVPKKDEPPKDPFFSLD